MRIITISREFGSGGREIGKRLADELGIIYYDREIILEIAKNVKMDADYIESTLSRRAITNYPYTFRSSFELIPAYPMQNANLLAEQYKVIRSLAEKGDCVIVGRSACVILDDYKPFKLFVYADMASKKARCRSRAPANEKLTDRELERKIKQIDKSRAESHNMISPFAWGDKRGYDLCVNTTNIEIKSIVPAIAEFAEHWFDLHSVVKNEPLKNTEKK